MERKNSQVDESSKRQQTSPMMQPGSLVPLELYEHIWSKPVGELRRFLSRFSPQERREMFHSHLTPVPAMYLAVHRAFITGDKDLLQLLLDSGGLPVDWREALPGRTLLFWAVESGHGHFVQLLLSRGADVLEADRTDQQTSCGLGSLVKQALRHEHDDHLILRQVLEAGADVNSWSFCEKPLLVAAVETRSATLLSWLVEHRAVRGSAGFRQACHEALCVALRDGSVGVAEVLWAHRQHSPEARLTYVRAMASCKDDVPPFGRELLGESSESEQVALCELLGAVYVLHADMAEVGTLWTRAMQLRCRNPQEPVLKQAATNSLGQVLGTQEVQTMHDLEALMNSNAPNAKKYQAVLIMQRLAPCALSYLFFLWKEAGECLQRGDTDKGMALLHIAIDATKKDPRHVALLISQLYGNGGNRLTFASQLPLLDLFTKIFSDFKARWQNSPQRRSHELSIEECCEECKLIHSCHSLLQFLLYYLATISDTAKDEEFSELAKNLVALMQALPPFPRVTKWDELSFVTCPRILKIFIQCSDLVSRLDPGIDPPLHLRHDFQGDTLFHIVARRLSKEELFEKEGKEESLVTFLEDRGAHICTGNSMTGERVWDILQRRGICVPLSLKCIAAWRVAPLVRAGRLQAEDFPPNLVPFIMQH